MGEKTINQQLASQVEQLNGRVNERAKQEGEASQAMAVQLQVGRVSTVAYEVGEFRDYFRRGAGGAFRSLSPPPFRFVCLSYDEN